MRNFVTFVMVAAIAVLLAVAVKQHEDIEKMRKMWALQLVIDDAVIGHMGGADSTKAKPKRAAPFRVVEL